MQSDGNPSSRSTSVLRKLLLAANCAMWLAAGSAMAITTERLPITMSVVSLPVNFSGDHGVDGFTSSVLSGLPDFDTRLGSLDQVVVTPDLLYSLPSLLWTVTALADKGHANVRTDLALDLGGWLRDGQTGQRLDTVTQLAGHSSTCGGCWPGSGNFGSFSYEWGDEYDGGDGTFRLLAATPKAAGLQVEATSVTIGALTRSERVNMQLAGAYTWAGQLQIERVYHAYTTAQYVANAVARASSDLGPLVRAQLAGRELVNLRTQNDAATSGLNESLRSAEYNLMGFLGAAEFRNEASLDSMVALIYQSPLGVAGHNTIKGCKAWVPGCAVLWQKVVSQFGESPTGPLPESKPGGFDANLRGWLHGLHHPDDIEGLAQTLESGVDAPRNTDPMQPDVQLGTPDGGRLQIFQRDVRRGETLYIDPDPATVVLTFASGAGITALELPSLPGSQMIDRFTLTAADRSLVLSGGELHDLVALFGAPLDGFALSDLQGPLLPEHLIIGLRFDRDAQVDILQVMLAQPVPEPQTAGLLLTGLLALIAWHRRRN